MGVSKESKSCIYGRVYHATEPIENNPHRFYLSLSESSVFPLDGTSKLTRIKDLGILTAEQIAKLDELTKSFIGSIPDLDARINSILGA